MEPEESYTDELRPWTIERVLGELASLGSLGQREPLEQLRDQVEPLIAALREAVVVRTGVAQLNAAAMLLRLQQPAGREPFLRALSDADTALRDKALDFLQYAIKPEDSRSRSSHVTKAPIRGDEILACVKSLLREPWSGVNERVLDLCLWNDIEGSHPTTRRVLRHKSRALRLKVAERYLMHGRDDGALRVLENLYIEAPRDRKRDNSFWYDLKGAWLSVLDCCQIAGEPLRSEAARMAIRVLSATLDAADVARRTDVNDGFVEVAAAAQAIAAVMPEGADALLNRVVACDTFSDYDRGQTLIAYANAVGRPSRPTVFASLQDRRLREYAAAAFGVLGKNLNDAEDIAALESALETEERTEVVAALVKALMDAGPDGGARAAAALGRVDLWTRFNLALRLDGGGSRELADLLTEAGVIDRISDSDLPETTGDKWDLLGLLLAGGERLVVMDVKGDDVPPHHHALCRDLLRIARPRIAVENLSQSHNDNYERTPVPGSAAVIREIDLGTACIVRFTYEGKEHEFAAHPSGRWLDVASVMSGFNAFMAAIGRDDRCFELLGEGSYVFLIVAPASKFLPLAQRLQIPLESDSEGARDAAKAYAGQIRRTYSLNSGDAS